MKKLSILASLIVITVFASACSAGNAATPNATATNPVNVGSQPTVQATVASVPSATLPAQSKAGEAKTDNQGAVTVVLTPENLDNPGDTLVFDVSMDTHSVNLGMDLSKLAILTTDTNQSIPASSWDGPKEGGHHVSGKLAFSITTGGKSVLEGASQVTVTITDVDAPSRVFTWQLSR